MSTRVKINGLLTLTRPVNVFIAMLSIFIAAFLCGSLEHWVAILLAALSGGVITAASNTINDYYDVEIDKINKPSRPVASGLISKKAALLFSVFLYAAGIIFGALINEKALLISALSTVLLYFYSARFKRMVLLGNLTVSLATGMAFIYGGIAVGNIEQAVIPAIFAFMMHFGREIIKDMEDIEGDRRDNAITLPVKYGLFPAQMLTTVLFVLLIVITLLPYPLGIYGSWYLWVVMAGVNTVLLFSTIMIWIHPDRKIFSKLSVLLKADMLVGLLAIYVGRW